MLRLRELRHERQLTQKQLAEKLGISQQVVGYYETEKNQPSPDMLIQIADFFQCSIDYLLSREDDFGNIAVRTDGKQLTADEDRLLTVYRKLTEKNKMHVSAYAQVRLEEQDGGSSSLRWK